MAVRRHAFYWLMIAAQSAAILYLLSSASVAGPSRTLARFSPSAAPAAGCECVCECEPCDSDHLGRRSGGGGGRGRASTSHASHDHAEAAVVPRDKGDEGGRMLTRPQVEHPTADRPLPAGPSTPLRPREDLYLSLAGGEMGEEGAWVTLWGFFGPHKVDVCTELGPKERLLHARWRDQWGKLVFNAHSLIGWGEELKVSDAPFRGSEGRLKRVTVRVGRGGSSFDYEVDGKRVVTFPGRVGGRPAMLVVGGEFELVAAYSSWSDDLSALPPPEVHELKALGGPVAPLEPLKGAYDMVVGILSSAGNAGRRAELRRTWLRWARPASGRHRVAWRFVVGRQEAADAAVRAEHERWGDILVADMAESYRSLAYKTLFFYRWLATEAAPPGGDVTVRWAAKTDDDCFLHLGVIMGELQHKEPDHLWWSLFRRGHAIKNKASKWYEPRWNGEYPDWGSGAGQVMSADLVRWLGTRWGTPDVELYANEDTTVGIAFDKAVRAGKVTVTFDNDRRWHWDECRNSVLSIFHLPVTPLYNNVVKCGKPCGC